MKRYIIIALAVLLVFTFFLRLSNFKKERPLTFDEYVYSVIGTQAGGGLSAYNTIGIYEDERGKGRKLPKYFKRPLFKHPPVFPYLVSVNLAVFGKTFYSAFKVSLFFGVLLILLTYLMCEALFKDREAALYAAFLMSVEPISWMCSQKIWMETTLAFFTLLSLYLFLLAVRKYNPYLVLASGVSCGLAALTKYPGILAVVIIFLYALCYERRLFKKKAFIASLFIPFIMVIPWFWWYYRVYGADFPSELYKAHSLIIVFRKRKYQPYMFVAMNAIAILTAALIFLKNNKIKGAIIAVCAAFMFFILRSQLFNAFDPAHVPAAGWKIAMFSREPWHFYLGRMLEFSPFYLFSFLGLLLFVVDKDRTKKYAFLVLSVSVILAFYIWWRNYQSRYVLVITAPLMILSAMAQVNIWRRIKMLPQKRFISLGAALLFAGVVIFFLAKTIRVDMQLAVPNAVCYF
ncbi:ArnT family glycosyltransferase [Candidatus Omnitrophota bacterium]